MLSFLRKRHVIIGLIVFVVLVATGIFFYLRFNSDETNKNEQQSSSEAKKLYQKVGKHFVLPTDELPTIATVTDPDKLQGQTFFAKAKKGDKVLIFTNAKEAILYDPVIDKVVTVAPLNIDENNIKEGSGTSNTLNNF
jgi:uncharacterized membrane protein